MTRTPVIYLYGTSDSGKTRLVERLLRELSGRGLRVATIKLSRADALQMDTEGKDTHRHVAAGSVATAATSRSNAALFVSVPLGTDALLSAVLATGHVDMVLIEGLGDGAPDAAPKIAVGPVETMATGTMLELPDGEADLHEVLHILDRVMAKAAEDTRLELRVGGQDIAIKPFVQNYLEGTVRGAVGALRGTGAPGDEIVMRIPRRPRD